MPILDSWISGRRRRALASDGVLVVHKLLRDQVAELSQNADRLYALLAAETDFRGDIEENLARNVRSWRGIWFAGLLPYLARTAPDLHDRFAALLGEIEARCLPLFDDGWKLCPERSYFRRHVGDKHYVPWHMDADAARTLDIAPETVNVWLPLQHVGRKAPSLEFIKGSDQQMRNAELILDPMVARPQAEIDRVSGKRFVAKLRPGDAIAFTHYTLHRTQKLPMAIGQRTACELRFMDSSPAPVC